MRSKRLLSLFVMVLIISLPISFAEITGGSLNITRSSGNADIEGLFDGYEDNWNIEVRASIGNDEVKPSYLKAQFPNNAITFDSCNEISYPFYSCSFKFPQNPSSFPENELILPIILTHPVTGQTENKAARIGIDSHPPIVTIHSIIQQEDDALIDYTVEDGGNRVCSIDKIEFMDGSFVVLTLNNLNITGCNPYRNQTLVPLADVGTSLKSVRIVAYDKLGHTGDAVSDAFTLDNTPPAIDINSFLFSTIGQDAYIPNNAINTDISVNIAEEQTTLGVAEEPLTVTADFSQLGLTSLEPADNCELIDSNLGIYTCTWTRFISIPSSFSVTIVAEDNNNLSSTRTISKSYSVDDVSPIVEYLGGNESMFVILGLNTLKTTIRETQSGINPDHISLDITGINPSSSTRLLADECIQKGDLWDCYWKDITATRAGLISLLQVKDIANNFALDLPTLSLGIDTDLPVIESIDILSLGGIQTEPVPFHEEGSYLEITSVVSDLSGVKAKADFSNVISNLGEVEGSCILTDSNIDQWTCTWSGIGPLTSVAAATTKDIDFEFEDLAGNRLQHTESIEIIDTGIAEPNPDYWTSTVGTSMPEQVDRQIAALVSPIIFVPVSLNPTISSSPSFKWPLLVKDITCNAGSEYLHTSYPPEIVNYNPSLPISSSTFPYTFYVKLAIGVVPPPDLSDSVVVNCSYSILSYVNGQSVPNPERESVLLTTNFYNNPLGEVDQAVQNEIDHVKDSWLVKGTWIDIITEILYWSEVGCETAKVIYEIGMLLGVLKDLSAGCCGTPAAVYCCPAASSLGAAEQATSNAAENYWKAMAPFCKIISCNLARGDKMGEPIEGTWAKWLSFAARNNPYNTYSQGDINLNVGGGDPSPYWANLEPKDSMILSAVFLCPTGFMYNLNKARQIECKYAYCLEQSAAGMPVDLCVTQRSFAMCMFVWNEIFQFIPFADMIDDFLQTIGNLFDNPGMLLNIAAREGCRAVCSDTNSITCNICEVIAWADWLINILCDLGVGDGCEPYWDTLDPIPDNYCKKLD